MCNKHEIDEMLEKENHETLCLSPHFHPIKLAWAGCKTYCNKLIQSKLDITDRVIAIWRKDIQICPEKKIYPENRK